MDNRAFELQEHILKIFDKYSEVLQVLLWVLVHFIGKRNQGAASCLSLGHPIIPNITGTIKYKLNQTLDLL